MGRNTGRRNVFGSLNFLRKSTPFDKFVVKLQYSLNREQRLSGRVAGTKHVFG